MIYDEPCLSATDSNVDADARGRTTILFKTSRWLEESGSRHASRKEACWNRQDPARFQIVSEIPATQCNTVAMFNDHLRYYLSHLHNIVGYYQPLKWRRRIWKMAIKRQKAYASIVRMLTGVDVLNKNNPVLRNTVVAYGAGSFSSVSPGYAPTPRRALFQQLGRWCKVKWAAEYLTTQTCSGCESELAPTRHTRTLQCRHICRIQWNRDINAAINIRYVHAYRNDNNGERPQPFVPPWL